MTHKERFTATIERKPVDRPSGWLGLPLPDAHAGLFKYFQVSGIDELKIKISDDIYPVELPYHSAVSNAIYAAFDFAKTGKKSEKERTLTAPVFFENYTDPSRVEDFNWSDPGSVANNLRGRIGDYVTPEFYFSEKRPDGWRETCQSTNGHWGYNPGQPLPLGCG